MSDSYIEGPSGRVSDDASGAGSITFGDVEDRLVEAMITCWRTPDRERGWQLVRSTWPEVQRELRVGDYDARGGDGASSDVQLRAASQTRVEVAEMEEAFGWVAALSPEDRKLVGIVVTQLAQGQREVSWLKLLRRMGMTHGAEGLRKRYGRAIAEIAAHRNGRNPREMLSSG